MMRFVSGVLFLLCATGCNYYDRKDQSPPLALSCENFHERTYVYDDNVEPVVRQYCLGCHGPSNKVRLDSYSVSFDGMSGAQAWERVVATVKAGKMPPAGSVGPSPSEVTRLEQWIKAGAPRNRQELDKSLRRCNLKSNLTFSAARSEPRLLPFVIRMNKVQRVAQLTNWQDPLLATLLEYRRDLGHHSYVEGIQPGDGITENRMFIWAHGLKPVCSSPHLLKLYPWPQGTDEFIQLAYGRPPAIEEKALISELSQNSELKDEERLTLFCVTLLSSLEFVTL